MYNIIYIKLVGVVVLFLLSVLRQAEVAQTITSKLLYLESILVVV